MVMPTPPMMCSLESNTSSIASGQLCNTQVTFLLASFKPMPEHGSWYGTRNRQPESLKAPVNHRCHSNTARRLRELVYKGKTDKLVTHISPSLCGWLTVIAQLSRSWGMSDTAGSFGWSLVLNHSSFSLYLQIQVPDCVGIQSTHTHIHSCRTLVMSTSSGSPRGQVSFAIFFSLPAFPQQFSCNTQYHGFREQDDLKKEKHISPTFSILKTLFSILSTLLVLEVLLLVKLLYWMWA